MKRFFMLGLLAISGCAAPVTTKLIRLTPANETALQDGTPVAKLYFHPKDPQATVSFSFADGDTLAGNAIINQYFKQNTGILGQATQPLPDISTVEMLAIDDRQEMDCSGSFSPRATDLTCNLSDGAVYRDQYIAPPKHSH